MSPIKKYLNGATRMTAKELQRLDVLIALSRGEIKMSRGTQELGITKRHFRKVLRRYE